MSITNLILLCSCVTYLCLIQIKPCEFLYFACAVPVIFDVLFPLVGRIDIQQTIVFFEAFPHPTVLCWYQPYFRVYSNILLHMLLIHILYVTMTSLYPYVLFLVSTYLHVYVVSCYCYPRILILGALLAYQVIQRIS